MEESAEKPQMSAIDEILAFKAAGGSLSESQQQTLHRTIRATVDGQIKERLDQFAKRVVRPQLELMKVLKKSNRERPAGEGKQLRPVESDRRGPPPAPVPQPPQKIITIPWKPSPFFSAHYAPQYNSSGPFPGVVIPASRGFSSKVEFGNVDGNISLGGAVGGGYALGEEVVLDHGAGDRWMFGDASIASASYSQLVSFPAWGTQRNMVVSADIIVGSGASAEPEGTWIVDYPSPIKGWVGILGDIFLLTSPPSPVTFYTGEVFVYNWATGWLGGGTSSNYFQPKFSISGTIGVPPQTNGLLITVTAWAAALRVTLVDGYETDGASFQFLDPNGVKIINQYNHMIEVSNPVIAGFGGPGPIRVTGIDAFM